MDYIKNLEEVVDATVQGARVKVQRSWMEVWVAAMLAGVYIAMGGVLSVLVGYGFPGATEENPILSRLLSGAFFPLGLILVVFLGAELFTGNNATLIPATMRGEIPRWYFLKNWLAVYLGNFIGVLQRECNNRVLWWLLGVKSFLYSGSRIELVSRAGLERSFWKG